MLGSLLEEPGAGVTAGIYARDDGVHLRFTTHGDPTDLDAQVARCREALSEAVWGLDDDHLPEVALSALGVAGAESVASWEADTNGALLTLLAGAQKVEGAAAYVGGTLDAGGSAQRAAGRCGDPAVAAPRGRARPQPGEGGDQRRGPAGADRAPYPRQRRSAAATGGLRGAGPGATQRGRLAGLSSRRRRPWRRWAFPPARRSELPAPRCSRRRRPAGKGWRYRRRHRQPAGRRQCQ